MTSLPRAITALPLRYTLHVTSSLSLHGVLARSCIRAAALTGRRPASGARVACAARLQRRRGSAPAGSGGGGAARSGEGTAGAANRGEGEF